MLAEFLIVQNVIFVVNVISIKKSSKKHNNNSQIDDNIIIRVICIINFKHFCLVLIRLQALVRTEPFVVPRDAVFPQKGHYTLWLSLTCKNVLHFVYRGTTYTAERVPRQSHNRNRRHHLQALPAGFLQLL